VDTGDKYDGLTADEIYEKHIKGTDIELLMQPVSAPDEDK
jgi:hypothetical protein